MDAAKLLSEHWGYKAFLPPQAEIVEAVFQGEDVFACLATGSGKSLCFQLPVLAMSGSAVIVSPLLALMRDQVLQLRKMRLSADFISSENTLTDNARILDNFVLGKTKFLYVSPERFREWDFRNRLEQAKIAYFAVDEAHCITQWGHDFRPAYLELSALREAFPSTPIIACTASADPLTREKIMDALALENPKIFVRSIQRKNLTYTVEHTSALDPSLEVQVSQLKTSALVFVRSRKETFRLHSILSELGIDSDYFHARIPKEEKKEKIERWRTSQSVMVCTNAFGMGMDKGQVEKVVHYGIPSTLEEYMQEVGRAGRDGMPAKGVLFYNEAAAEQTEEILLSRMLNEKEFYAMLTATFNQLHIAEGQLSPEIHSVDLQKFPIGRKRAQAFFDFLANMGSLRLVGTHGSSQVRLKVAPQNLPKNGKGGAVLEQMQRRYAGLHQELRNIDEWELAQAIEKSIESVRDDLKHLRAEDVLEYLPKHTIQVQFIEPRDDRQNKLWWRKWKHLQDHKWKKWQAMRFYVSQKKYCREMLLRRYFGEETKEICGRCDVCRLNQNKQLDWETLRSALEGQPQGFEELRKILKNYTKEVIQAALREAVAEDKVHWDFANGSFHLKT